MDMQQPGEGPLWILSSRDARYPSGVDLTLCGSAGVTGLENRNGRLVRIFDARIAKAG